MPTLFLRTIAIHQIGPSQSGRNSTISPVESKNGHSTNTWFWNADFAFSAYSSSITLGEDAFVVPLLVTSGGYVIDGQAGLEVARSQGLATVECIELASALQAVADALDAVADLVLAERVHQLLRGNTVCAGATLDAIARSDAPPPEIDVIQTPRSGTAFTSALYKTCPLPVTTRASHFISVASLKTAGHPSFTQNS